MECERRKVYVEVNVTHRPDGTARPNSIKFENDEIYDHIEDEVNRKLLGYAMGKLSVREREIVEMRFGLAGGKEMTQKEVADFMGISQSYVSRLEKKIIGRLQSEIKKLG